MTDFVAVLRRRIDGALVARFIAEGATKALSIVTAVALARLLAVDGFGGYAQIQALCAVLVPVVMLGLGFGIVRRVAAAGSPAEIVGRLATAALLVAGAAFAGGAALWFSAPVLGRHVLDVAEAPALLRAAALLLAASALHGLALEALRARQRAAAASILQIAEAAAFLAAVVSLAMAGDLDAATVVVALAAIRGITALAAALHLVRRERLGQWSGRLAGREELRHALAIGLPFVLAGIGDAVLAMADRLLIGTSLGAEAVGRYAAAQMLATLLASWGTPFWWLLYPRLSGAPTEEGIVVARRLLGGFAQWGVGIAVALMLAGDAALRLIGGPGYDVPAVVIALLVATVLVHQTATPWEYALYVAARAMTLVRATFAWGLIAVLLTLVLLPVFGLAGAAAAALLARFGFAATIVAAAGRIGMGRALLPRRPVLLRIAAGLGGGLVATVAVRMLTAGTMSLRDTAVFSIVYVAVVAALAWRQARRSPV